MRLAIPLRLPERQHVIITCSFFNLFICEVKFCNGKLSAPLICPSLNSAGVRTSTTMAPEAISSFTFIFGPIPNKFFINAIIFVLFIYKSTELKNWNS